MNYEQVIKDYNSLKEKTLELVKFIFNDLCLGYIEDITFPPTISDTSYVTVKYQQRYMSRDLLYLKIPLNILLAKNWKPLARKYKEKLREEKCQRELQEAQEEVARLEYESWLETERYMQQYNKEMGR